MMVLGMTGGLMIPLMLLPEWMQQLASVNPIKWSILAWKEPCGAASASSRCCCCWHVAGLSAACRRPWAAGSSSASSDVPDRAGPTGPAVDACQTANRGRPPRGTPRHLTMPYRFQPLLGVGIACGAGVLQA